MKINKVFVSGSVINVRGSNVTIVNGRVIGGDKSKGKAQKFDVIRTEDVNNVDALTINSEFVNVYITDTKSSNVELHLYGEAEVDGKLDLDVELIHHELKISVNTEGNCFNSNLQLDIAIPNKKFESIIVKSVSADIDVYNYVYAKVFKVGTTSGDVSGYIKLERSSIVTKSGDVYLHIDADNDIDVELNTMSGDVNLYLLHIEQLNISTYTISGDVRKYCRDQYGYNANVDITTMSGNITIH